MNNTKHILSSVMTYHQVCNNSNSTGATNGAGTLEFIPFVVGSYNSIFRFICNVLQIRSLLVPLSFVFLLSILRRLIITTFVSSNFSLISKQYLKESAHWLLQNHKLHLKNNIDFNV